MNKNRLMAGAMSVTSAFAVLIPTAMTPVAMASASAPSPAPPQAAGSPPVIDRSAVRPEQRDTVLPKEWRTSSDVAWTTSGDATGFHVLVAEAKSGYSWRTAATLAEPGVETDQWVGNACVTASGRRVVVVYAPRAFTNEPQLARRGAFTAIVDLRTGAVRKLRVMTSLAYFNPGCGVGDSAVLTQEGDEDLGATRLLQVNAATGALKRPVTLKGQVTSAVPTSTGIAAASGFRLIQVDGNGKPLPVAVTNGVPASLRADGAGGVVYLDRAGGAVRVLRTVGKRTTLLAEGGARQISLSQGTAGHVFLAGHPTKVHTLPSSVRQINAPAGAEISTEGDMALTSVSTRQAPMAGKVGTRVEPDEAQPAMIDAVVTGTGRSVDFTVDPQFRISRQDAQGRIAARPSGAPQDAAAMQVAGGSPSNPMDTDGFCSVSRNNVRAMAYQPTPRQVEWAVDMAVQGTLTVTRPAGFKGFGLPAYSPQGLFPPVPGGVHVPPQIFLGILSQESNLWQVSHAMSGEYGNPLTGNAYGLTLNDETGAIDDWIIHWDKADCGYGISQRTDGMRSAAHPKQDEVILSDTQQKAVALDYATNIAAGMSLIQDKWKQVTEAGMQINNGDPARIENWFFATWAYNSGFHPESEAASQNHGAWGLGWFNNPANPRYPERLPFLYHNTWADAAQPQKWPYPEKVIGFASYAIDTPDGPGFRPAWWINESQRDQATPPANQFCDTSDQCIYGATGGADNGPCFHEFNETFDSFCWYHQSATWKPDCANTCGNELVRFDPSFPEQPDGTNLPPLCTQNSGLPGSALIVDDIPDGTPIYRCGAAYTSSSAGSFSFSFSEDPEMPGTYPGKIDLHQLGGGNGGHFWFAHTRKPGDREKLTVTGTWTLGRPVSGWARIMVHTPDHGAHSREAKYTINDTLSSYRVLPQRTQANKWVSLGVFEFNGTPQVSLSSQVPHGTGDEDIAWDAIAVQPLPVKPRNFVVAMGDSYSSGEGASVTGGGDYYKETDVDGGAGPWRDACHRSKYAWSRKATLSDSSSTIGERADDFGDISMDYHLIACSGAVTANILSESVDGIAGGQSEYGELPQLSQGYVDRNTTLVTLSIGGNDALFGDIVTKCISGGGLCQNATLSGETRPLTETEPELIQGKVRQSIVAVLKEIHRVAPNAKIALMGYPILLENNGQCVPGIGTEEAPWMNQMGVLMVQQMNGAVNDANQAGVPAWFADPSDEFAGQAICGDPETIHGIVADKTPGDDPDPTQQPVSSQSFHPKIEGTTHYADALVAVLPAMGM